MLADDTELNNDATDGINDDVYARHLSSVDTLRPVTTAEDIYDINGSLLVTKGQFLRDDVVDRIVRFKLLKPLDQSISITHQIKGEDIYTQLFALLEEHPDIKAMYDVVDSHAQWKHCCQQFEQHPILIQKVTVYRDRMPRHYKSAVFGAWASMCIAQRMALSAEQIYCAFLGALIRDIGILHINPDILSQKGRCTLEQWRTIQSHVVIAKKIIERCEGVPKELGQAVLEHHERYDGSGYPFNRRGNKLNTIGQIIAVSDTVCSVYTKTMAPKERGLRDTLPVLKLNANRLALSIHSTMVLWLQACEFSDKSTLNDDNIQNHVKCMLSKNALLGEWVKKLLRIFHQFSQETKNKRILNILNNTEKFVHTLRSGGLLDEGYIRWLNLVVTDKLSSAYREVEDYFLMLQEMQWQLNHITHQLEHLYHNNQISKQDREHVAGGLEQIREIAEKVKLVTC